MEVKKINIIGTPLFANSLDSASQIIIDLCLKEEVKMNRCVSATGAHGLVFAKKNQNFREVLQQFYLNLPDGMPGVWVGRIKGAKNMRRCYGPDVFKSIMIGSRDLKITHFFCGGNDGVAGKLREAVKIKFGNNNIVDTFCPPFLAIDQYDYPSIAAKINEAKPNIVWIGLSTPKQEYFADRLKQFTNVNFIITVGAAFDFHTDKVTQAPSIIQSLGLEWFFRLLMEPRRLYKRYLEIVPLFIYYNVLEFLRFAVSKFKKR